MVAEPVPDAIRAHHQDLIILAQVREVGDFWFRSDTDASCSHVTDRSRHGKTRHLLILEPDALRTVEHPSLCTEARHGHTGLQPRLFNPAVGALDAGCFVRLFRLVVT